MNLKPHKSRHGNLLAVSMMKDEAPFLLEWYAHHLAVGFTKILVYTNDCSDGTVEMLQRLEAMGLGYHRHNVIPEGSKPQPSAMKHAQSEKIVHEADWLLMFDADEFLCINYGDGTLDQMLDAAGDANGIVITWRIFGSSNITDWSREPVTEQYLHAAPPTWNKGWGVKTLFKFDPDYWKIGIHRPSIKNRHLESGFPDTVKWLNGSGMPMEDYFKFRGWRSIRRTVGYQWAQMNHYAVKSIDSYAIRKFRGNVNNKKDKYNSDYWALQDRNEVRDENILRYNAKRQAIMDELLKDPILNKLHFAAIENIEARLATYKKTEAYETLKQDLIKAGEIPITQVVAKPPKARDPKEIAALMSRVEKTNAQRPVSERRSKPAAEFRDMYEGGDGFVTGDIDISVPTAVEWVENHGILLPGDVRIFSPSTLDAVLRGRYQRRFARYASRTANDGMRLLDIGAGVNFLSFYQCLTQENTKVFAQEDNASRHVVAQKIMEKNGYDFAGRFEQVDAKITTQKSPKALLGAMKELVETVQPDAIRMSDGLLGGALLPHIDFSSVKRITLIEHAAHAFIQRHGQNINNLTINQEVSFPDMIILDVSGVNEG